MPSNSKNTERAFELASIEVIKGLKKRSKYTKVSPDSLFHASSPGQAASKAFIRFCKLNRKKFAECKVSLAVKEQGANKLFAYSLERINDPQKVTINGKVVTYKYKVVRKSLK